MNQLEMVNQWFCVFRSGDGWYGLPAEMVGQVTSLPELTWVPQSDSILCGLAHVRNEYVPVFSLGAITDFGQRRPEPGQQLMVIQSPQGSWGLLVDQTIAVTELETSFSRLSNPDDRLSLVTCGTASYRDRVLQILDPAALVNFATRRLNSTWETTMEARMKQLTRETH